MTSLPIGRTRPRSLDEALASPRVAALIFAALVAAMAAPALIWPIPRGNDIVDHWARLTLYHMAADDPLNGLYRVRFGLIPNLGLDALYLALSPLLSAQSVVRLAWMLAIALPAWGAWALHRALFEKPSPTIWLIPFLSYNVATTGGLLNFALGMGLALLGLAYVVKRGERLRARDFVALNLIGAALFFCHLIAWAAFGLLLLLTRVKTPRAPPAEIVRQAGLALLAQALPLALVALREAPPSTYELGGSKLTVLLAPVASMTGSDLAALGLLIGVSLLALVKGARPAPSMRLALAGFALCALLVPSAHGAANLIDARLAVYVWYFALAVTSLPAPAALRAPAAALAVALVATRLVAVAPAWPQFQERAATVRSGLAALPPGARALVVAPTHCADADFLMFENLTAFAVIDRRAYVNTLFAQSGLQPVAPADAALDGGPTLAMDPRWLTEAGRAQLPAHMRNAPWAAAYRDWRRHFTHVIDAHGGCASTVDAPGLTRIGGAAGLDVYRAD
jgi:hypothetical protein